MAREGVKSKKKISVMKSMNPDSKRSISRSNRGFKGLEQSSRKHRRAAKRSEQSRYQYGKVGQPGEKIQSGQKGFLHTCGGSLRYH